MYYSQENENKINAYLKKIFFKRLAGFGRTKKLARALYACITTETGIQRFGADKRSELISIIDPDGKNQISGVFSGESFGALKLLMGEKSAVIMKSVWERMSIYPYSFGWYRKPFRSSGNTMLYLDKSLTLLQEMVYINAFGEFDLASELRKKRESYEFSYLLPAVLAAEIDSGNENALNAAREIIYGENENGSITRELIYGLLMSRSPEAHELVGNLMLAARLQEGLRQAVAESMDEGSKEAYLYMLKLILDNDLLLRFSSVVRALDTATGLLLPPERKGLVKKCFELAYRLLSDNTQINQCIESDDNLEIYMSLWATAFDEVMNVGNMVKALASGSLKYKKLTALYFLHQTFFPKLKNSVSISLLAEDDLEVLGWSINNLFFGVSIAAYSNDEPEADMFPDGKSPKEVYGLLKQALSKLPKKAVVFKESVFPWHTLTLTAADILEKMLVCAYFARDDKLKDELLDYREKMSVDTRKNLVEHFLSPPATEKQKIALVEALGDKGIMVRNSAKDIISKMKLGTSDFLIIEGLLRYKYDDLRKNCISLLLRQTSGELFETVSRLFSSPLENSRMGAIELVSSIKNDKKFSSVYGKCEALMLSQTVKSQAEQIRASEITNTDLPVYTAENGFGLFDPAKTYSPEMPKEKSGNDVKALFAPSIKRIKDFYSKLSSLIHENREYQYESVAWNGSKSMNVLGSQQFIAKLSYGNKEGIGKIENYPLSGLWTGLAAEMKLEPSEILAISYSITNLREYGFNSRKFIRKHAKAGLSDSECSELIGFFDNLPYASQCSDILNALVNSIPPHERFAISYSAAAHLFYSVPKSVQAEPLKNDFDNGYSYYFGGERFFCDTAPVSFWLTHVKNSMQSNDDFKKYFNLAYSFYKATDYKSGWRGQSCTLDTVDFGRAFEQEIIDENELIFELCGRLSSPQHLNTLTNTNHYIYRKTLPFAKIHEIVRAVVGKITEIEIQRGEMATCVTHLASSINECYGAEVFSLILLKMENSAYVRGYNFIGSDGTKKQIFSHLLKCCRPNDNDDAAKLRELLKGKKVSETQLIDAAMYSPNWLGIIEDYLGWEGLKSAAWYFHAHTNGMFSNEKLSVVARYSSIEPMDLMNGAFDVAWFWDAYNTLGEKRFRAVYDSAKYVASAGQHRRAQLFADAVTGKLNAMETEKTITEKRNKDHLLAYALIPAKNKRDTLHRYELIQAFLAQSKQFGAQRQASEGIAARLALTNLAQSAGFRDVNRLMWQMETEKMNDVADLFIPKQIGETTMRLVVSKEGLAEIEVLKDEKRLKDIPSKLKKNEDVLRLKSVQRELKKQHARARASLENAMVSEDYFELDELKALEKNPVISPLISSLVFISSDKHGYFKEGNLVSADKNTTDLSRLTKNEKIRIAHPADLYRLGVWAAYQRDLYESGIIQPFKQVFREFYKPNADELKTLSYSTRYAGHQVQPSKAFALLKGRGWTANYDEGLQKVFFKENVVVSLYALADWFSPADIEAPTLESVTFYGRKNGESIMIDNISPVLFSEVMRDVDLVVSTAHAGGVDPEASLSTIEMRESLITEMLRLLKIENVELRKTHAFIKGAMGEYTVHLGSGTAQKMAAGSIFIIPVHSQHRGRIFLPFMDDDPKTAEIISKIVLLAEDKKIKDPEILRQIR